jgi:NADPH:quinone reductase-like Zn-dependent oxidoreductase
VKAQRVNRFGPPDAIVFEDIDRPTPGAGELLVRVRAAGVGPWDAWVRAGKSLLPQPLPLTLGSDISGVVEAIGPGVSGFESGEAVYGVTNAHFTGGYAEFAIAAEQMVASKPRRLTDLEAASVPVVAVTAWQMVHEHAGVKSGQRVLVHGAAGNVGAYAVQFARLAGARVVATSKHGDVEFVRSIGAEEVIDSDAAAFENALAPVDAVIDTIGGDAQTRSFVVIRPDGVLVSSVSQPDAERARIRGVRAVMFIVDVNSQSLTRIAAMIDAGDVVTSVGAVLPLAQARQAHEMLEGRLPRPRGKIVLRVSG